VNRNKLTDINYLSRGNLKSLRKVNASYNQIDREELDNLAHLVMGLENLDELDLYGNDAFNDPKYKFRLSENS
jgi:hypothetical protein